MYVIDNDKYGDRTEFASLDEIRTAARELAPGWGCDPDELAEEMVDAAELQICEDCGCETPCLCQGFIEELRALNIPVSRAYVHINCGGGFGLPWLWVPIGEMEISPVECDGDDPDYFQDGDSPLKIQGWVWRMADDGTGAGQESKIFDSAADAIRDLMVNF